MKKEHEPVFRVKTFAIPVRTCGYCDVHDLTDEARRKLLESGIHDGQALFFVPGSTAGLTTVEYEPGLIEDLKDFFEKIAPVKKDYHHEQTWHDGNGFSHVRASLLKPSLQVPVKGGQMMLGTWQQVVLIDFDNTPRDRSVVFQVMGI